MTLFGKQRRPDTDAERVRVRGWLVPWIEGAPPRGPDADDEAVNFYFFDGGLAAALQRHGRYLTEDELRRGLTVVARSAPRG